MPRGRKKADTAKNNLNNKNGNVETAAEIAAPVEVKTEQSKKTAETANEKSKSKSGRKPKTEKNVVAEAPKSDKKAIGSEKKTSANRGRKPSNNTSKNAISVPAPADTAASTTEKPKRTYTKKAKSTSTKTAKTEDVIIQSSGNEYTMSDITEMCKIDYRGGSRKQIKSITVYIKAENNGIRAYYVVNENVSGHIDL